jgi:hypothetical protein
MDGLHLVAQTTFRKDRILGWKGLWQRWRNRPATSRPARPQPRRQRARLAVEQLEDRLVPAVASVQALVDAINAANAVGGANIIELPPRTTFTLTASYNTTDSAIWDDLPVHRQPGDRRLRRRHRGLLWRYGYHHQLRIPQQPVPRHRRRRRGR